MNYIVSARVLLVTSLVIAQACGAGGCSRTTTGTVDSTAKEVQFRALAASLDEIRVECVDVAEREKSDKGPRQHRLAYTASARSWVTDSAALKSAFYTPPVGTVVVRAMSRSGVVIESDVASANVLVSDALEFSGSIGPLSDDETSRISRVVIGWRYTR